MCPAGSNSQVSQMQMKALGFGGLKAGTSLEGHTLPFRTSPAVLPGEPRRCCPIPTTVNKPCILHSPPQTLSAVRCLPLAHHRGFRQRCDPQGLGSRPGLLLPDPVPLALRRGALHSRPTPCGHLRARARRGLGVPLPSPRTPAFLQAALSKPELLLGELMWGGFSGLFLSFPPPGVERAVSQGSGWVSWDTIGAATF